MANKFDTRQSIQRSALPMIGSSASEGLDSILGKIDPELSKLFEDRNVFLIDGGLITFTGTDVQFTEALKLHLNSKVAGGAPVVIDLAATTRAVSASGRMIYAVIDRGAGTATVTADATTLPAVTSTDQEVFLIAKRVDAGDGTKRLYFRNGMALNEGQTARLGASGSGGSGAGLGDDLNALSFKASFSDIFEEGPSSSTSAVDSTRTNATYNAAKTLYRLSYDATKTVTGTGTAMTMSAGPAFTVAVGDMLIVAGVARRITAVATQTSYTIEAAFPTDPSASACTVSQAVHTKDVRAHDENSTGRSIATLIADDANEFLLKYNDSSSSGDDIPDFPGSALVAYSASADNSSWSGVLSRSTALTATEEVQTAPTSGSQFKLRFFAAATSGSGAVNLLDYKVFLHRETPALSGDALDQAYGFLDGTGTEINSSLSVVGGKTRISLTWHFPVGVNSGKTNGAISVYINGQKIPRYVDGTLTPDASYVEISSNTIELDQNYITQNLTYEVLRSTPVVDSAAENSTKLSALESLFEELEDKVTVVARPRIDVPNTTIVGRAQMVDLANDLKARFGNERILVHELSDALPNETGPNGEVVRKVFGDLDDKIRFVGDWASPSRGTFISDYGHMNFTESQNSFIEVTFWGTGLTLLGHVDTNSTRDIRVTIDGGAESANIYPATSGGTGVLNLLRYSPINPINVAKGLSEGLHTVKIRNAAASSDMPVYGFEIHNENASIKVNPGAALSGSRVLTLATQVSVSPNSGFDVIMKDGIQSTSIGSKGAHVSVYLKSDGSVAKSAVAVDTTTKTLTNTDHSNEELIRKIFPKEFGRAGVGDDFTVMDNVSNINRHMILQDNATSLKILGEHFEYLGSANYGYGDFIISSGGGDHYFIVQFIGTGLDLEMAARTNPISSPGNYYSISVDNGSLEYIQNIPGGSGKSAVIPIVSGLPYGIHTVRFGNLNGRPEDVGVLSATIYGPKKPTLPAGSVEIAEYFLVADVVNNTTVHHDGSSTGVIRRGINKDWYLIEGSGGTSNWQYLFTGREDYATAGRRLETDRPNAKAVTVFTGTGFDFRYGVDPGHCDNVQFRLNGVDMTTGNFATMTSSAYGGTFNATTGELDQSQPNAGGAGLIIKNLPFATYVLEIIHDGTGLLVVDCLDIITPVHFPEKQKGFVLNQHLDIGAHYISDRRKFKLRADEEVTGKTTYHYVTQSVLSSSISTYYNATFWSATVNVEKDWARFELKFSSHVSSNAANRSFQGTVFVDGREIIAPVMYTHLTTTGGAIQMTYTRDLVLNKGTHLIQIYFYSPSGGTTTLNQGSLAVTEV